MARLRPLIHEQKRMGLLEAFEAEMLRNKDDARPFKGQIDGYSFQVRRDKWKVFSSYPRIWGAVIPAQSGSRVRIALLTNTIPTIGFLVLTAAFVIQAVDRVADALAHGVAPSPGVLAPIMILFFFWLQTAVYDASDIRSTLVAALGGTV